MKPKILKFEILKFYPLSILTKKSAARLLRNGFSETSKELLKFIYCLKL
jgi:hypothetical protein